MRTATSRERSSPAARRRRAKRPGPPPRARLPRATAFRPFPLAALPGLSHRGARDSSTRGAASTPPAAMLDCAGMNVLVRPARERGDYDACVRLQREVWGLSDLEITSAIQLVATVHAGGSLLVAESAGETVGLLLRLRRAAGRRGPPALGHAGRAPGGPRPRRRAAPQVGAAGGGAPPRPAPRHLDVRPDAGAERPPQPPPPRAPWPARSCRTSTGPRAPRCTTASRPTASSSGGSSTARASHGGRPVRRRRRPTSAPSPRSTR